MPTTTISKHHTTLKLDTLLSQLRLRGIAVGTVEMQRLHSVFEQSPQLTHTQLRHLLSVMLAKDDKQRASLNRLFDQLVPHESEEGSRDFIDTDLASEKTHTIKNQQPTAKATENDIAENETDKTFLQRLKTFSWRNLQPTTIFCVAIALLASIILVLSFVALEQREKAHHEPAPEPKEAPKTESNPIEELNTKPGEQPLNLVKTIDYWSAQVESKPIDPWPKLLPWLALLFGSGLAFSWLLHKALKTTQRQPLKPPKIHAGKGRFQVPELAKRADYHLLSGEQRKEMRWGISRYLSEQPLNRLDIKASVESSAKTGIPEIKFLHASEERDVWLWQDQSSNNKDLLRLVEEISHSLQRGNIPVQKGYFRGIPSKVLNVQKEIIWSSRHDYPENAPLVVIFADGESLARQQQHDSAQYSKTLHQLSQWENLCIVDNSYQSGTLQRLLNTNQITCLLPQEVPAWLARQGEGLTVLAENCSLDNLRKWAIACALPTRILMEDEIRAVHDAMGLSCAWQFHALERYAVKVGAGFDFRAKRIELLNEVGVVLSELNQNPEKADFAVRAISFWQQRNLDIDASLSANELNTLPDTRLRIRKWKNTELQQTLKLDSALLELWQKPAEAAKALSHLHAEPALSSQVSEQLNLLSCVDFGEPSDHQSGPQIQLPYSWHELDAETQRQLLACGFGGVPDTNVNLRWDNTTWLMLAGFASVALASFVLSSLILMRSSEEPVTRLDSPEPLASARIPSKHGSTYLGATFKSVGLYGSSEKSQKLIQDKHQLTVSWTRKESQAAQFDIDNDPTAQLWLLGEKTKPQRPVVSDEKWPDLSIAVIYGNPKNRELRRLAAKLLDTGSADQVLLGGGHYLRKHHQSLIKQSALIENTQWLYIGGKVLIKPDQRLGKQISHWQKAPMALLNLLNQSDDIVKLPPIKINSLGASLQAEKPTDLEIIELANNLKLIKLPRGNFQMGSNTSSREEPIHPVTIDYDLWMGQTEVTFEQYDAYAEASNKVKPEDQKWGRGIRPVINVSWNDAQEYAKWVTSTNSKELQCRLPSEAEWEYAARAGTQSKYFWGDDIGGNNANCFSCGSQWDGQQTAPVGSFSKNGWGLQDMHGNVREWVQDPWHADYKGAPNNGEVWEKGGRRMLRGGMWNDSPNYLRSAYRGLAPTGGSLLNGFRIVCSPPLAQGPKAPAIVLAGVTKGSGTEKYVATYHVSATDPNGDKINLYCTFPGSNKKNHTFRNVTSGSINKKGIGYTSSGIKSVSCYAEEITGARKSKTTNQTLNLDPDITRIPSMSAPISNPAK